MSSGEFSWPEATLLLESAGSISQVAGGEMVYSLGRGQVIKRFMMPSIADISRYVQSDLVKMFPTGAKLGKISIAA